MTFLTILVAIFVFGVVIVVHELGHFWAARRVGILVEEFSIGLGPRLLSFKPGETRYSLKLFPFGGSCRMLGDIDEDNEEGKSPEEVAVLKDRSFLNKPVRHRMFVILAGVVMNLILAIVFSTLYIFNNGFIVPQIRSFVVGIAELPEESRVYELGFRRGDRLIEINAQPILSHYDFWRHVNDAGENEISLQGIGIRNEQAVRFEINLSAYDAVLVGDKLNNLSQAQVAGLQPGDRIITVADRRIRTHNDFRLQMAFNLRHVEVIGDDGEVTHMPPIVAVDYIRDGELRRTRVQTTYDENRQTFQVGFIADRRMPFFSRTDETGTYLRAGFAESIVNGFHDVSFYVRSTLMGISRLATGRLNVGEDMGGPIILVTAISDATEASLEHGGISAAIWSTLWFAAFISSNLFVFNLLPIPALDGGKMVFLTIEAIRRKPISPEKEGIIHFVGFVLLMIFAVFVAYNDIMRLF